MDVNAYPHGVVDADGPSVSRGGWLALLDTAVMRVPRCGVAIDATVVSAIEVQSACEAGVTAEVRLSVWAVEDEVTGPDQMNFYDVSMGHPYFGAGNPIVDFVHEDVLRGFLTSGVEGEVVDVTAGTRSTIVDGRAACIDSDCTIVAFVSIYDGVSGEHHVEAVETAAYGQLLPW